MRDRNYDDIMAEMYLKTPADSVELIDAVLEDGDPLELLITLRQMVHTMGGVVAAGGFTATNPELLSAMLANEYAPSREDLAKLLRSTKTFFERQERAKQDVAAGRQSTSRVA